MTPDSAQTLALQALGYLVADTDRRERFVAVTGLDGGDLRRQAGDPAFLGGVLDHMLGDERVLLEFCSDAGVPPDSVARARQLLPGAAPEW